VDFHDWGVRVQSTTERFLTWRKRRRLVKKERQKQKNVILDWLEAIGSAVLIVLLINQFFLQAYQIPSQSMVSTLEIGDRIFVNKLIYGPELIPGMAKINFHRKPRRAEIIIFENPSYISSGPLMEILQRVIYMVTLSLVDIDRDEFGNPKHHFLIKRAVGMPGDRLRLNQGNVEFLLPGETKWIPEQELQEVLGFDYEIRRMFSPSEYGFFEKAGIGLALLDSGLSPNAEQEAAISRYFRTSTNDEGVVSWRQQSLIDNVAVEKQRYKTLYALKPYSHLFHSQWRLLERGWYVPEDRIFPMGDNRDDSRDARYFGPVRMEKVLGRALFRYWPIGRLGGIRS
jgi:signal peptidase I